MSEKISEPLHPDFEKILNNFIRQYGKDEGKRRYYKWLNKHNLDDTKSYSTQSQFTECLNGICEAFRWTEPFIQFYREDEDAKYYKTMALTANVSMNRNDYEDAVELARAAKTLTWRRLNINHDHSQFLPFPDARVDWAEFEDNAVEAVIRIPNYLDTIQRQIEDGDILHVSIEGEPRGGKSTEKGRAPLRYNFTALALLERDKTLPGDPLTYLEPLFLRESMGRSLVESLSVERKSENIGNTPMSKETVEDQLEEWTLELKEAQWTTAYINDLPNSSFTVVEPCADERKDARHLPYKDAEGKIDLPHLRNALARMNQVKSVCGGSDESLRVRAKRKLIPLAKKHLPGSKYAELKLEEYKGIGGMDVCGQCKYFTDLSNTVRVVDHLTGADDSRQVHHASGAIGPGVGICQVATKNERLPKLVRKQDPACTDGRPRDTPTDLDRTVENIGEKIMGENIKQETKDKPLQTTGSLETVGELILKSELEDVRTALYEQRVKIKQEIDNHLKTQQQLIASEDKRKRALSDLAVLQNNFTRVKGERDEIREKLDKSEKNASRLQIWGDGLEKDVALYKNECKRVEEANQKYGETILKAQNDLKRALTKANEESAKRAEAQQRALDAETERNRAVSEAAELIEDLTDRTREVSDSTRIRSEQAKRAQKYMNEIDEGRKKIQELTGVIRDLKQKLSKSVKKVVVKT